MSDSETSRDTELSIQFDLPSTAEQRCSYSAGLVGALGGLVVQSRSCDGFTIISLGCAGSRNLQSAAVPTNFFLRPHQRGMADGRMYRDSRNDLEKSGEPEVGRKTAADSFASRARAKQSRIRRWRSRRCSSQAVRRNPAASNSERPTMPATASV